MNQKISSRVRRCIARSVLTVVIVASVVPSPAFADVSGTPVAPGASKSALSLYSKPLASSELPQLRPLDADDLISGAVALPASPAGGSLNFATDKTDAYTVALTPGTRFTLVLTGADALNADAYLYDPFVTDADASAALVGTLGDAYPKKFTFDVPAGLGGDYHLVLDAASGSGAYTVTWSAFTIPSGPDDDIPGVVPAASPFAGSLAEATDVDDVFAVAIGEGDRLQATLSGPAGTDFDLHLYAPDATSLGSALPITGSAGSTSSESFVFDVPAGDAGVYYLAVHSANGSGAYTLDWSVDDVPAGAWETAAAATPLATSSGSVNGTLDRLTDANDYRSRVLAAGDHLEISLSADAGTDFDVYVYGPGSSEAIAWSNGSKYPERVSLDVTTAGTYYIEVVSFSGSGAYTLTYVTSRTQVWSTTDRLAGDNRFQTAVALSADAFAAGSCDTVVLATGENFPDALSAAGLAGVYDSPILLTKKTSVPAEVLGELARLGATKVVIVGGPPAVGPEVVTALRNAHYSVSRIDGLNRYSTSAAVAREIARLKGSSFARAAFVARGDVFADALALAPFSYSQGYPVLLTRSDALVSECSGVIGSLGVSEVFIAGSKTAVSDGVMSSLNALPSVVSPVVRLAGTNRYETAAAIAEYGVDFWWGSAAYVGVATGLNFPDALGGGAVCGSQGGVMLLTAPATLSKPASDFIKAHAADVLKTEVYGGKTVVYDVVKTQINALLQ